MSKECEIVYIGAQWSSKNSWKEKYLTFKDDNSRDFPMQQVSTVNIEWMKSTTPTTEYYSEGRIR